MSDLDALRDQYANDRNLRVRQEIHDLYTVPRLDYPAWVMKRTVWDAPKRILDVGSGSGIYFPLIRERYPDAEYYAADLSAGMLQRHGASYRFIADASQLPFSEHTFDVVMANHMLFHVMDLEKTVQELKRILHPDGIFTAATNSIQTMPEFQALFRRALLLLSSQVRPNSTYLLPPHNTFTLENGVRKLTRHFRGVVRHDIPTTFVFPTVEPVIAYLDSMRSLREPNLPSDVTWEALMEAMYDQVNRVITLQGELVVSKLSGVIIASNAPDFVAEYCSRLFLSAVPD